MFKTEVYMNKEHYKTRKSNNLIFYIFIISLLSVALFMNISKLVWQIPKYLGQNEVAIIIERFKPLSYAFQPCKRIGYITDLDVQENPLKYKREFTLICYALSPALVVRDPNREIVVGNFHNVDNQSRILNNKKYVLVHDLGDGVLILRKHNR